MSDDRSIELEVEVAGTPEEVWQAIATGPGISSWYVPHEVEEADGGAYSASFGPGMDVHGTVAAWEPPHRFKLGTDDDGPGLAFEWLIEAQAGGTCIVRLVNTGFGTGEDWDDMFDGMSEGWPIFLENLRLHCQHFGGQAGSAAIPLGIWDLPPTESWQHLTQNLGINPSPTIGDSLTVSSPDAPPLSGTVTQVTSNRISLLIDSPAPGTAFIAAEGQRSTATVSIWLYLYGHGAATIASDHQTRWSDWFATIAP